MSWMPSVITSFLLFFGILSIYLHFFRTWSLQCPQGVCPVWYENLSGVVSCPENSNINTDRLDSVVIGSRDQ